MRLLAAWHHGEPLEVDDAVALGASAGVTALLLLLLTSVLEATQWRPWLFRASMAAPLHSLLRRCGATSLRALHTSLMAAQALAFVLALAAFAGLVCCIAFANSGSRWGAFRQRPLALVFLGLYLICALAAGRLWARNQWALAGQLRLVSILPPDEFRLEAGVSAMQRRREGQIRTALMLLLLVALACAQLANLFLIPLGKCPGADVAWQFRDCDAAPPEAGAFRGAASDSFVDDRAWQVALEWTMLLGNALLVIAATFLVDARENADLNLIMEAQTRIAEAVMRYGLAAAAEAQRDAPMRARAATAPEAAGAAADAAILQRAKTTLPASLLAITESDSLADTKQPGAALRVRGDKLDGAVRKFRKRSALLIALAYAGSLCFLAACVGISVVYTDRYVALFEAAGLLLADSALAVNWFHAARRSRRRRRGLGAHDSESLPAARPWQVAAVLLATRIVLLSVPTASWFLGQTMLFVVGGTWLCKLILDDYLARDPAGRPERQRAAAALRSARGCGPLLRALLLQLPAAYLRELLLLAQVAYLAAVTALLSEPGTAEEYRLGARVNAEDVVVASLVGVAAPQWKLGVLALLVVGNLAGSYAIWRAWLRLRRRQRFHETGDWRALGGALAALLVPLAGAVASAWFLSRDLFASVKHFSLVGTVATLLPALLATLYVRQIWAEGDFVFWLSPRAGPVARRRNAVMCLGSGFVVLCIAAFGVSLHFEVFMDAETPDMPALYSCALLSLLAGLLAAEFYFNTLDTGAPVLWALSAAHVLALAAAAGVAFADAFWTAEDAESSWEAVFDGTGMLMLVAPAFVLLGAALLLLRDDGFRPRPRFWAALLVSLGILATVGVWFGTRYSAFVGLVYFACLAGLLAALAVKLWWEAGRNDARAAGGPLRAVRWAVLALGVGFFVLGVADASTAHALQMGDFTDPLYGGSYLLVAFSLAMGSAGVGLLAGARRRQRNSTRLSPSPGLLGVPVVAFKVENAGGELAESNGATLSVLAALLALQMAGFLVSWALLPSVGVSLSCVAVCLAAIFALHVSTVRGHRFRRALAALHARSRESFSSVSTSSSTDGGGAEGPPPDAAQNVFDRVLEESVRRCMDIADQAIMSAALKSAASARPEAPLQQQQQQQDSAKAQTRDAEAGALAVRSTSGLLSVMRDVRAADAERQRHLSDSAKYAALFHELVWMRTKQTVSLRRRKRFQRRRPTRDTSDGGAKELSPTGAKEELPRPPSAAAPCQVAERNASLLRRTERVSHRHLRADSALARERTASQLSQLAQAPEAPAEPLWEDAAFPATNGSLFEDWDDDDEFYRDLDPDDVRAAVWCRPHELLPPRAGLGAPRMGGPYDPTEVLQGGTGDCWLLSALSVVALYPELMARVLPAPDPADPPGSLRVHLCVDGAWRHVLVDDRFPCALEESLVLDPAAGLVPCDAPPSVLSVRDNDDAGDNDDDGVSRLPLPQYCRSRSGAALWCMAVEKAFAKRAGSYEALTGGHVPSALVDLTGGFTQLVSLRDDVEVVVSGAIWARLCALHRDGALLAAGSPSSDENDDENDENGENDGQDQEAAGHAADMTDGELRTDAHGIVHGHAYAIERVAEEADFNGAHRLLRLRDPWGVSRWRGRWARGDAKSWTRRMQRRLGTGPEHGDDPGAFWISLEDFVASFRWLYVCQLFDPARWTHRSAHGLWQGATAGGPPNQPGAARNPQFALRLRNPRAAAEGAESDGMASVFVSITSLRALPDRRFPFMALLLLDLAGQPLRNELLSRQVVADTGKFRDAREASLEARLPVGRAFTLFPALFPAGEEGAFRISVYCEAADFDLEPLNQF